MKKEEFLALMSATAHDLAELVVAQHPESFEETPKPSPPTPSPEGATYPSVGCKPYENNVPTNPEPCKGDITTEARAAADEEPPQAAPRQRRARFPWAGW